MLFNKDYFILFCGTLLVDYFSSTIQFFILIFYVFIFTIFIRYKKLYNSAFYVIFFSLLPILFIFLYTFDLFLLTFMLETLSISLYFLIILSKKSNKNSIEVVFKYFFVGALSTFLLLIGISFIYGHFGTTSFFLIKKILISYSITIPYLLSISISLIIIAFLLKLGIFPFNWWVPDIYEGMSYSILLYYNTIIKVSIFTIFIKLVNYLFFGLVEVQFIIYIACIGSLLYGCFSSLNQLNIKRFMAFTGINNFGWLLIGLCCGTIEGLASTLIYLFIYTIMNIVFWFTLARLEFLGKPLLYFSDINNLAKNDSISALIILITISSMAGFPPFGGFFSKYCLLLSATNSNLYSLVFLSLFVSALSGYYYLKLLKVIFFDNYGTLNSFNFFSTLKLNFVLQFILFICIYFLICLGFLVFSLYSNFIILAFYCFSPIF